MRKFIALAILAASMSVRKAPSSAKATEGKPAAATARPLALLAK